MLPFTVTAGQFFTATATVQHSGSSGPGFGDTSEFSQAVMVTTDATGEIRGMVWHDFDTSGTREDNEPGLAGWTVFLDENENALFDSGERTTVTNAEGRYAFVDLAPGTYSVGEILPAGWLQASPLTIPDWVYVVERVYEGHEVVDQFVEIFDFDLEPQDSFRHDDFNTGLIADVEVGPLGDVFVGVDTGEAGGAGEILWFTFEGEFVGVIPLPDDPVQGDVAWYYPWGFDVLTDGRLVVAQPNSQQIILLDVDGTVEQTFGVDSHPVDVAGRTDPAFGFVLADSAAHETFVNFAWPGQGYWVTRGNAFRFSLEGNLEQPFASGLGFPIYDLVREERGGFYSVNTGFNAGAIARTFSLAASHPTIGSPLGVALAGEVPYDIAPAELLSGGAEQAATEIPVLPAHPINSGRGTWSVHVEASRVTGGVDFGVAQLSTAKARYSTTATAIMFATRMSRGWKVGSCMPISTTTAYMTAASQRLSRPWTDRTRSRAFLLGPTESARSHARLDADCPGDRISPDAVCSWLRNRRPRFWQSGLPSRLAASRR